MSLRPLPINPEFVRLQDFLNTVWPARYAAGLWPQLQRMAYDQQCSFEYVIWLLYAQEKTEVMKKLYAARKRNDTMDGAVQRWASRVTTLQQLLDEQGHTMPNLHRYPDPEGHHGGTVVPDTVGAAPTDAAPVLSQKEQQWYTFLREIRSQSEVRRDVNSWYRLYRDAWTDGWMESSRSPLRQILRCVKKDVRLREWEWLGYNMLCMAVPAMRREANVDLLQHIEDAIEGEDDNTELLRQEYETLYANYQRLQMQQIRKGLVGAAAH